MALNSASNVLRETNNPPLTNNNAPINGAQYDQNIINIYNDLVALNSGGDVPAYDPLKEYDDATNKFVSYSGFVWLYIFGTPTTGTTPIEGTHWTQVPPSVLAHSKNQDSHLDLGGSNEVSALELNTLISNQDVFLYNNVVNDTVTSSTGSMETFDIGQIVDVPTMAIGDKIKTEMHFNRVVNPGSDGFGLYFLWHNIKYTPPSASTPTYGNSIIQMPFNKEFAVLEIEVTRISSSEIYIYFENKLVSTLFGNTEPSVLGFASDSLDTDTATRFEVQAFVAAGGELNLQYLSIKHIKA